MTRSLFTLTEDGRSVMLPDAAVAYKNLIEHTVTCAHCNTDQRQRRALRETRR
ncbi:hypothetical protein ACIQNU_27820 [Streptomyces sp. NPDC091292]|uniref:hypothetical protein n=1 Tax=Streptomyces sp. NPDC091292 TaxID=3365991 RepID=UPI0037F15D30